MSGGIVVVDDYFPSVGTGFRLAEFSWLLRRGVVSEVLTTVTPLDERIAWYSAAQPLVWQRVRQYDDERLAAHELAYVLFLNNAHHHVDTFERLGLPFVVTLYPGGGLYLDEPEAEAKLERVLTSPMLRHVVTTQGIVTERVRRTVGEDVPVTEIVGVVVDPEYLAPGPGHRDDYFDPMTDGSELDLCFVAHRYTPGGADKGFPEFVQTLRGLRDRGIPVRGHVVGGFSAEDLPDDARDLPITFLGTLPTVELRQFFASMDVIVSPTRPDTLAPGAFDGFPTGATVEAALSGVAIVASDARGQNTLFRDGRDALIVPPDPEHIVERLLSVVQRPGELRRLAQAGLATARRGYSVDRQLWQRRTVLESALEQVRAANAAVGDDAALAV
ncbi:glycosyltransferase family 4 protein [Curtobacterium sp. 22159]|uniref:glycosyltransferase family 4 protein n=1 Tax=Curtobacterium sp. 22159 TaxID=3453882 RepID=UPI003F82A7D3